MEFKKVYQLIVNLGMSTELAPLMDSICTESKDNDPDSGDEILARFEKSIAKCLEDCLRDFEGSQKIPIFKKQKSGRSEFTSLSQYVSAFESYYGVGRPWPLGYERIAELHWTSPKYAKEGIKYVTKLLRESYKKDIWYRTL